MGIEIKQIGNIALKDIASEIDKNGNNNGFVDNTEINLFTEKAVVLLREGKCNSEEFANLFAETKVINNNTADSNLKTDFSTETIQELTKDLNSKIAKNNEKLMLYEASLAQKEIPREQFEKDLNYRHSKTTKLGFAGFFAGVAGGLLNSKFNKFAKSNKILEQVFITVMGLSMITAILSDIYDQGMYNSSSKQGQENIRNKYKEEYLKLLEENKQLQKQIDEIQNLSKLA